MVNDSYFFIINPKSGHGKGLSIVADIEKICSHKQVKYEIYVTQKANEATSISKSAIDKGFSVIVAVGGDGTVNEVGAAVVNTNAKMGIIPLGSGNGLAREMNIPLSIKGSLATLFSGNIRKIDTGTCNDKYFACTAGVGFDAHMASKFLTLEKRGFIGYVKLFLNEFFTFKDQSFEIQLASQNVTCNAVMITVANCKQWGNEFYISPLSKHNDGFFEICIIRKFPLALLPIILYRVITKTIHRSKYYVVIKANSLEIRGNNVLFNTDGELHSLTNSAVFEIKNLALSIIC